MSLKGFVVGHNTGLGDQIIMNGATRCLVKHFDKVWFVTWENRAAHAKFLYRDCPNVEVYVKPSIKSSRQGVMRMEAAHQEIVENNPLYTFPEYNRCFFTSPKDWARFCSKFEMPENTIFPRIFYAIMGVPYVARFKYENIPRDSKREEELYNRVNPSKPYAFCVNDSRSSKYNFEFETDLDIINPLNFPFWQDTLLYDWQLLMERADEIHMVNTSWFHLAKTLKMRKPKLYYSVREIKFCEDDNNDEFLNDEHDDGWLLIKPEELMIDTKPNWWLK
jgi:hypothetical protein